MQETLFSRFKASGEAICVTGDGQYDSQGGDIVIHHWFHNFAGKFTKVSGVMTFFNDQKVILFVG